LLLCVLLAGPARAQLAPVPDAPPQALSRRNAQTKPAAPATIPANAGLIDLYFLVRGPHKKLVPNLTQANCTVVDNGVPQTLKSFTARTAQPLTLGLLLDTSFGQQRVLPTEKRAVIRFLRSLLRPQDEAFVISFNVDVTLLSDLTSSPHNLERALDSAHINSSLDSYVTGTIPSIGKPKGALLYDAVDLAATRKLQRESGRKAVVLLTAGVDKGSRTRLKTAIAAAQKANGAVYILLVQSPNLYGVTEEMDAGPMRKLARATGGQVFRIGSNGRKMQAALKEIENQLRHQYRAVYKPSDPGPAGSYRRVQIDCRQGGKRLHPQARQGYYAQASRED